jgi:hypothetical protein
MSELSKIFVRAVLVAAVGLVPWHLTAGETRIESGSVALLKQERRVNLEFDYTELKAGRKAKECLPEQEFIAQQVARENEKHAGRGESWRQEWLGQRTVRFQPRFQELLNKQFVEVNIPLEFGAFKDAKYTLILKTKTILTGSTSITADAVFVETNNRANTVAVVKLIDMPGRDPWAGSDMREAYAKAGKELGILIRGKIK